VREPRDPTSCTFMFTLPAVLRLGLAVPARIQPCIHQVAGAIDPNFGVRFVGPSETHVTDQASRFLEEIADGHGTLQILASMIPPGGRAESWTITTGAKVSCQRGMVFPRAWPPAGEAA
jgi:hypothetical protein